MPWRHHEGQEGVDTALAGWSTDEIRRRAGVAASIIPSRKILPCCAAARRLILPHSGPLLRALSAVMALSLASSGSPGAMVVLRTPRRRYPGEHSRLTLRRAYGRARPAIVLPEGNGPEQMIRVEE